MESSCRHSTVAKRMRHIVRVVFFMLRKGFPKRKVLMDLHLLLCRGKLAGKALGNLLATHHHTKKQYDFHSSSLPNPFHLTTNWPMDHRHGEGYEAEAIAMAFKMLDDEASDAESSPAVRKLRVTDSPFSVVGEDEDGGGRVDEAAEEFIRRFYEQLRRQPHLVSVAASPELSYGRHDIFVN